MSAALGVTVGVVLGLIVLWLGWFAGLVLAVKTDASPWTCSFVFVVGGISACLGVTYWWSTVCGCG